ncbi:MAG: hypothetical protein M3Q07_25235 [Pseudobdellovibrionaceae bacterium]|nr:hypothetical protein [Pseudobdellovibrionaceae bacterium]
MPNAEQNQGDQGQAQADDQARSGVKADSNQQSLFNGEDGDITNDEVSGSMNVTSTDETIGLTLQDAEAAYDSADPAPPSDVESLISEQRADIAASRQTIEDDRDLSDERRPKDGSMSATADAGADDDENTMPTGIAAKPGFEDYNPATRRINQAGDSLPDAPAGP